jgi:hypothetical protein
MEKEELSQADQQTLTKLMKAEKRATAAPQGERKEDDEERKARKFVQKERLKGLALVAARVDRDAGVQILGDQGVLKIKTPEEEAAERLRKKELRKLGRENAKAARAKRPKQHTAADIVVDMPTLEHDLADLEAQIASLREEVEALRQEQQEQQQAKEVVGPARKKSDEAEAASPVEGAGDEEVHV